jgi:putative membrane protein
VRGLVVRWIVCVVALHLTSTIVRGIEIRGIGALLAAAAVIGLVNAFVRPVLVLLTLPLTVLTLGLFAFVLNALMLLLASSLVPGFEVRGFWAALWGWILLSLFTFAINVLIGEHGRIEVVHFRY